MADIDLSAITEEKIVVSEDKKTAVRYKVVEENIDLEALRREKEDLEQQLLAIKTLKYPKLADEVLRNAIDAWNATKQMEREYLESRLEVVNNSLTGIWP